MGLRLQLVNGDVHRSLSSLSAGCGWSVVTILIAVRPSRDFVMFGSLWYALNHVALYVLAVYSE